MRVDEWQKNAVEGILGALMPPCLETFQPPLISWSCFKDPPFDLSFYLCTPFRQNAFRFFYEMVTRSLLPGRRLPATLQFAREISLRDEVYLAGEVRVTIGSAKELEIAQQNLAAFEKEVRLGLLSEYQANQILGRKGTLQHEKTQLLEENIGALIKRRPQDFDYDLYSEMHHFLAIVSEEFKRCHDTRHLTQILCTHYLFRKTLLHSFEAFPQRRYINVKLIRYPQALGVAIGLSFLKSHEVFEERHLLSAIEEVIPGCTLVEGSFFANVRAQDPPKAFYIEVQKQTPFSASEVARLKRELAGVLKNRIEVRLSPLFMPENEEENMRHMLTLSAQLKYVHDLPQVVINFHKQTEDKLEFLVVAARVISATSRPLADLFSLKPTTLECTFNRAKVMGMLRKKHQKEASVFRLAMQKSPFLRKDHSIDLYKARQKVAVELAKVLGDFRDYNGGIISKESELIEGLRPQIEPENAFLLENFFYALLPAVMRSVLPVAPLKVLFLMLVQADQEGLTADQSCLYHIQEDEAYFYLLLIARHSSFRKKVQKALEELNVAPLHLATTFVQTKDYPSFGVIYRKTDRHKTLLLQNAIEKAMQEWENMQL